MKGDEIIHAEYEHSTSRVALVLATGVVVGVGVDTPSAFAQSNKTGNSTYAVSSQGNSTGFTKLKQVAQGKEIATPYTWWETRCFNVYNNGQSGQICLSINQNDLTRVQYQALVTFSSNLPIRDVSVQDLVLNVAGSAQRWTNFEDVSAGGSSSAYISTSWYVSTYLEYIWVDVENACIAWVDGDSACLPGWYQTDPLLV